MSRVCQTNFAASRNLDLIATFPVQESRDLRRRRLCACAQYVDRLRLGFVPFALATLYLDERNVLLPVELGIACSAAGADACDMLWAVL